MSAADDSAVAATNCRRDSFVRDIGLPSLLSEIILPPSDPASKVCAKCGDFVHEIRAELMAAVEKMTVIGI
jgi:hypothetical protein